MIRCPAEGPPDVMALDTGPTGLLLKKVHGIVPRAMSPLSLPMKHEWGNEACPQQVAGGSFDVPPTLCLHIAETR